MPIDPATGSLIAQGVIAASQAITRGGPRRQYKWNKRAMEDANRLNQQNADRQNSMNLSFQREQREYDSPAAQMSRYKAAGLNPHLIYGTGSAASGGTFPINSAGIAPARLDAPSASYPDIAGSFMQAGQGMAQMELTQQRAAESEMNQALKSVLIDIAKTNPMLNKNVATSVADAMYAAAELKWAQARYEKQGWFDQDGRTDRVYKAKIDAQVEKMWQDLKLNTEDLKIKNEILESKEFQNAILEIQKNWVTDGNMGPEQIRQGFMLILSKMLGHVSFK